MNKSDLYRGVIVPALTIMKLHSLAAVDMVGETAIAESQLEHLFQIGGGPGRGPWQIEPFTARDILGRYLGRRIDLRLRLKRAVYPLGGMSWLANWTDAELSHALLVNLALGAVVCRLIYLWVPDPIPETVVGRASYWVEHYNKGGAATVEHYIRSVESVQ